jgi:hypothetical protein
MPIRADNNQDPAPAEGLPLPIRCRVSWVRDKSGTRRDAAVLICQCDSEEWVVYQVHLGERRWHLHFQCVKCGVSYCDQSCSEGDDLERK